MDTVPTGNVSRSFSEKILAATHEFAFGRTGYYRSDTGALVTNYDRPWNRIVVTDDGRHVWAWDGHRVRHLIVVTESAGVLANDMDPDGDDLVVSLETGPRHGTIQLQANGSFSYQPDAGFEGTDRFVYRVTAGSDSQTATVLLRVWPRAHNYEMPIDVNANGLIQPLDALLVINELIHRELSHATTGAVMYDDPDRGYLDVNRDGYITPVDALVVINNLPREQPRPTSSELVVDGLRLHSARDEVFRSYRSRLESIFEDIALQS